MQNELERVYKILKNHNIDVNEIIEKNELPFHEFDSLIEAISSLRRIYLNTHFIEVCVYNEEGNIGKDLRNAFPDYVVIWRGDSGTIGINVVYVPIEDWNDDIKEKISKFDSFVGVHQDKFRRRKRDEYGREIYKNGKYEYEEVLGEPHEVKLEVHDYRKYSPKWEKINEVSDEQQRIS